MNLPDTLPGFLRMREPSNNKKRDAAGRGDIYSIARARTNSRIARRETRMAPPGNPGRRN